MNIRVIGIVLLVVLFALSTGIMSTSISSGTPLNEAYSSGNVKVVQKSAAGTVPHQVEITNNGDNSVKVNEGNALASTVSQDLVIAEDKQISPNSTETVKAYCIEPSQRSVPGSKLLPTNNTYGAVNRIISGSNAADSQSAYNAQLKIWVIMSGGNLNPYTGEPVAVVDTKQISWGQFRQDIADAKSSVMSTFNVDEGQISNLNQNGAASSQGLIETIFNWIKNSLGL
ncbi:ARPP-1 family domain-containing protein [Methanobacterium sp. ACI-7]|uniref:ARPP-1 family domain-containing protein n=1 Tax=unclassified Methanobacterium TaxID=2627676 RepID=UPI0039C1561A